MTSPTSPISRTSRRTRVLALGAAAAFAATLGLSAGTGGGLGAAAAQDSSGPARDLAATDATLRTPFEVSGGARWTTQPEGQRFWRDLDAASERVEVRTVGRSVEGRPIQLVAVGDPAPASPAEAAEGSVLLNVCSIHGDEPSGREACLQMARDLAGTTDPAWRRLLRDTTVLFLVGNPDGWVADTRGNADGVDVNRDYLALATPEAKAVVRTIRHWAPDTLNDLHEYGPREYYDTDLLQLWPRNRQVDAGVHDLAREMSEGYAADQVRAEGYTSGEYGILVKDGEPFQQVAGDEQPGILRNYAGTQHVVGMLSETANAPLDAAEEADESLLNRRRVEVNYLAAVGSAQYTLENRATLLAETAAAGERATAEGAEQSGVVYFAGQDDRLPTSPDEVEPEPMCGYRLSADQRRAVLPTLRLHGVEVTRRDGAPFVSMAQPDQPLIPLLLDARSDYAITEAAPVATC
ncbi:M14 family zinc carboxypeptidase [Nocardioides lentus]|uniref:M14 family zinc carboxypeptidase n=1 Tax=Nocardioides lentus TaxID=338077 RepID=UPI0031D9033A